LTSCNCRNHGLFFYFGNGGEEGENCKTAPSIVAKSWRHFIEIRRGLIPDEFIVMPNHLHGIVRIVNHGGTNESVDSVPGYDPVETPCHGITDVPVHNIGTGTVETPCHGVSTQKTITKKTKPEFHWKSGVLGAIIGQYKQQVTKRIRKNGFPWFQWQPRFHDHIVRNEQELFRIRQYIKNNPANWEKDKFNQADSGNRVREKNAEYEFEPWMI
jgi:putative transposase